MSTPLTPQLIEDMVNQSLAHFGSPNNIFIDSGLLKAFESLLGEFYSTAYKDYRLTKSMQIFARFNVLLTKLKLVEPNEEVELREVVLHKSTALRKKARSRIRRREKSKGNK